MENVLLKRLFSVQMLAFNVKTDFQSICWFSVQKLVFSFSCIFCPKTRVRLYNQYLTQTIKGKQKQPKCFVTKGRETRCKCDPVTKHLCYVVEISVYPKLFSMKRDIDHTLTTLLNRTWNQENSLFSCFSLAFKVITLMAVEGSES